MKRVRLTQLDGKLPNLALMKLAHYHRMRGDEVVFTREIRRDLTEAPYDLVYGSAIFSFSAAKVERFRWHWPQAIVGGTGSGSDITVERLVAGPYLEMFARQRRPGWDSWGNEVEKFGGTA